MTHEAPYLEQTSVLANSYIPFNSQLKHHPLLDSCPLQAGLGVHSLIPKPHVHVFIRMPSTLL